MGLLAATVSIVAGVTSYDPISYYFFVGGGLALYLCSLLSRRWFVRVIAVWLGGGIGGLTLIPLSLLGSELLGGHNHSWGDVPYLAGLVIIGIPIASILLMFGLMSTQIDRELPAEKALNKAVRLDLGGDVHSALKAYRRVSAEFDGTSAAEDARYFITTLERQSAEKGLSSDPKL